MKCISTVSKWYVWNPIILQRKNPTNMKTDRGVFTAILNYIVFIYTLFNYLVIFSKRNVVLPKRRS